MTLDAPTDPRTALVDFLFLLVGLRLLFMVTFSDINTMASSVAGSDRSISLPYVATALE